MNKEFIIICMAAAILLSASCTGNENTPAKAGTSDSSGIGHEKGKGTPYRGDSATKRARPDTVSNK